MWYIVALAACVMAVLALLDRLPTRKENLLLFLTGLALLSAPALLIGISPKYQDGINVDWRHGYIPQTVESFGVGLMVVAVFVVLLRFVRGKNWWPKLRPVCSMLLAAGMACVSLYPAHLLTARLVQPIERMTAHLNNVSGVARYPELEPFMDMIEQQHEEILRSANMRVEFTANVSHELKTPLTSISGYAELIESGMAQGEQAKTFAAEIHKSANRLLTLINDIIRLSQMDAPMPDLKFEPVDLAQIAANTFEQLEMSARKADVTLQLDAKPAMVEADRQMMDELLYNLCDNAIRYNVHGGSVKLEVRPIRDKVIVCVQDTGIGISPENQEHVFERFYRVDKSRSKATGGTGLGLAIVKHIAVKHNAQIELESELGRGTKISVIFERCFKG